jgi:hypothetical protein
LAWPLAVLFVLSLAACSTRSISDSGYRGSYWSGRSDENRLYRGELSEFDVLGIERNQAITEGEIQASLSARERPSIARGASIMLIQSGAMFPDEPMVRALEARYDVGQFSGIPDERTQSASAAPAAPVSYSKALRLAAARGGYDKIIAYWGVLETAREGIGTKVVSWVPIVGNFIPDETQRMRIRLKFAVIDVKTRQWELYVPEPLEDAAISASLNRASSDQAQVALLKEAGYKAAATGLVTRYSP